MNITFAPRGILQIDDARIVHRNFAGAPSKFNREGDRNFSVVIPDEATADKLMNDVNEYGVGWNVKIKPARDEGDKPFMNLKVKVAFNGRGPNIYLVSGNKQVQLNEDTVKCLDYIDIVSCDMDIRPFDGEMPNGQTFRTAYLSAMRVHQRVDRFAAVSAEDDEDFDF